MAGTVGAGQGGVLMEPDTAPRPLDHVERAHLRSPGDASHVMYRYDAAPEFAGLLERFWIPVWSVPPGREAPQQVLQYPVTLLVVSGDYARFYGVVSGLSTTTLTGDGWAVGVMCAPAAGALVARGSVAPYTDRHVPLAEVLGEEGDREVTRVAQVCDAFGLSERALQRLVQRRLGLTPKWLIQRRRLQEAAERLRVGARPSPRCRRCSAT